MPKITRTREQQAADKADREIYHLAVRAERFAEKGCKAWAQLATGLHALRPVIRAKMHPVDFEATKG